MLEFADVNIDFFGSKLLLDWDWDWDWDRGWDGDVENIEEEEIDWTIFIIDSEEDEVELFDVDKLCIAPDPPYWWAKKMARDKLLDNR